MDAYYYKKAAWNRLLNLRWSQWFSSLESYQPRSINKMYPKVVTKFHGVATIYCKTLKFIQGLTTSLLHLFSFPWIMHCYWSESCTLQNIYWQMHKWLNFCTKTLLPQLCSNLQASESLNHRSSKIWVRAVNSKIELPSASFPKTLEKVDL